MQTETFEFDEGQTIYIDEEDRDGFAVYTKIVGDIESPLFVFLHGLGQTAPVFKTLAAIIHSSLPKANLLAFDLRGHGNSTYNLIIGLSRTENPYDITVPRIALDLAGLIDELNQQIYTKKIILVGVGFVFETVTFQIGW
jgi:pimeloyl-ACP methyl ester carboxylesterase